MKPIRKSVIWASTTLAMMLGVAAPPNLQAQEGPGAYIVQTLTVCGGSVFGPLFGCAERPGTHMYITLDTAPETRSKVFAHERGHNLGLVHPACGKLGNDGFCYAFLLRRMIEDG